ncbi:hypothetical protein EW146_g6574 [Bondarzewia mesenterica]|uniref:RBR-type E3 ubiquitin transferase n=1 Tax=Bondarzewia mesenterica TaxID=1095465 RepID=A0A4S4LTU6_9AGAM|nr:hypothetical protein EW146_g6574 [Bondarzewia mesenterica]
MATLQAEAGPSRPLPSRPNDRTDSHTEEAAMSSLMAQLSLEDIEILESGFKIKQRRGAPLTDAELAMSLFAEDARASIVFESDRAFALSLQASEPHAGLDAGQRQTNPTSSRAHIPSNQSSSTPAPRSDSLPAPQTWGSWLTALVQFVSSPARAAEQPRKPVPRVEQTQRLTGHTCVICQDPIRGTDIRAPCGDYYDIECMGQLFEASTRDESLYPPRCCRQRIPLTSVRAHLTTTLLALFESKSVEFNTKKRIYCARKTCSRFLGPQYEGGWFTYPQVIPCTGPMCIARTCNSCKALVTGPAGRHTCSKGDDDDTAVLALARTEGWSRCPGCHRVIELNMGCYHMTCVCRTEFCYLCRAKWKTCRCTQWDERRLIAVAEQRVDIEMMAEGRRRAPAPAPPAAPARAQNLPQAVPVLARAQRAAAAAPPAAPARAQNLPQAVPVLARAQNPRQVAPAPVGARAPERAWAPVPAPVQDNEATRHDLLRRQALARVQAYDTGFFGDAVPPPYHHLSGTQRQATPAAVRPSASTSTPTHTSQLLPQPQRTNTVTPRQSNNTMNVAAQVDYERTRRVRLAIEQLRVDHDCEHIKWRFRNGGGQCQTCYSHLPRYLFVSQIVSLFAFFYVSVL